MLVLYWLLHIETNYTIQTVHHIAAESYTTLVFFNTNDTYLFTRYNLSKIIAHIMKIRKLWCNIENRKKKKLLYENRILC